MRSVTPYQALAVLQYDCALDALYLRQKRRLQVLGRTLRIGENAGMLG